MEEPGGESAGGRGGVRVARGARAVEALLLREVAALDADARRDPARLARPVRIIVPSRSLRLHVAATLVRARGHALAGIAVQTLQAVALEVVERAGETVPGGDAILPVLVRRLAREEPTLRAALDRLVDGYGIVTGAVNDLLDAGFDPVLAEAVDDALAELGGGLTVERARATARVALRVVDAAAALGVGHRSSLLRRAGEILEREGSAALPARALLVHGFAEATALRADLIRTLAVRCGAQVLLDEPPDPAEPERADPGVRFTERLRIRLEGVAAAERDAAPADAVELHTFHAGGAHAEARAVAERVRASLDAGARPETIGVVARDLSGYRTALRIHFRRLGIPFSGEGEAGSSGAAARRVGALLDLLAGRGDAHADRWLDALVDPAPPVGRADLRVGLRKLGAVRLADVTGLDLSDGDLWLPVVAGLRAAAPKDENARPRTLRRVLDARDLRRAVERAGSLLAHFAEAARAQDFAAHVALLGTVLREDLGWSSERTECAFALAKIEDLASEVPPTTPLDADEFLLLLRRALDGVGADPIGGAGGGVQVLNAMEARARTFDELYVIGLNRDVFPRTVHPDPLLPDSVRRRLAEVLPEVPIKALGGDEERYLFAELVSSSPRVTLSWQRCADDGRECAASAFVERLRFGSTGVAPDAVESLQGEADRPHDLSTPMEHALRAGLRGRPADLAPVWAVALAAHPLLANGERADAARLAAARDAVLRELDAPPGVHPDLGPYFGFVGPLRSEADPRGGALYVTTVENTARCPWQTLLQRLLRIEVPPDPLGALPGIDARLVGSVVHRALDSIVKGAGIGGTRHLDEARAGGASIVAWPAPEELDALLQKEALGVLADEGIGLRALARALAARAKPFAERARELGAFTASAPVVGSELEGVVAVEVEGGAPIELRFRADLAEEREGALVLTDYKTGASISTAVKADTRERHLLASLAQGRNLQAAVYARAAGENGVGRFVFLRPELEPEHAVFEVGGSDASCADALREALVVLTGVLDAGSFFPRIVDTGLDAEPAACGYCEVAAACRRGDSGARRRLARWLKDTGEAAPKSPSEVALLAGFQLPAMG